MKSRVLKNGLALCAILAFSIASYAQQSFRYKANLQEIKQAGFYQLVLSPEVIAKCQDNLADIRIMDRNKRFVPYVNRESLPSVSESFISFPILENDSQGDSISSLVIENSKTELIRSLWLRLKNSAVSRTADLLGSDDKKRWFAMKEDILLQPSSGSDGNSYFQSLSFPASNYRYFKLTIHNKRKAPLQILQAGIYASAVSGQSFQPLPSPRISRKDNSDNSTYLDLRFAQSYQVNKVSFRVTQPRYFQRSVQVYSIKGKQKSLLTELSISSGQRQDLVVTFRSQHLQIQIANGDNPPLQIDSLQAWQLNQFLVAYLEAGKSYQLLFGDKQAREPDYDLKFFTDSAVKQVSEIKHLTIISNELYKAKPETKKENNTLLIWISIAAALVLLVFMSWRMLGEMKGKS
ncbi:MAG TPA: hypothetical protein VF602_13255 [Pedobacter sp.]|jgi:hypothetical protein